MFPNQMFLSTGKISLQLKIQKSEGPGKSPDLAQRVRSLVAQTDDEQKELTMGQNTSTTTSMCFLPCPDTHAPASKPQAPKKALNGSFADLDIPYIDEDEHQS